MHRTFSHLIYYTITDDVRFPFMLLESRGWGMCVSSDFAMEIEVSS